MKEPQVGVLSDEKMKIDLLGKKKNTMSLCLLIMDKICGHFCIYFKLFVHYLHLRVARPYPATSPVFHQHPESEKRYNIF